MRIFKFRAWEKNLKEIIPVHSIDFEKKIINIDSAWRTFDEIEIMQYIGFKDENGKEVYEGDIVEVIDHWYTNEHPEIAKFVGVIEYGNGSFYVRMDETYSNYRLMDLEMRVVGNVYENKELLERKDEYVYCTECVDFRLCDEGLPYCPYEDMCDISDCEDGKSIVDRPYHGSK